MDYLTAALFVFSLIIIGLILIQERSSGAGSLFGGGEVGGFYQRRRGLEKIIFGATIVSTIIFVLLSLLKLID